MTIGAGLLDYVLDEFARAELSLHSAEPGPRGDFEFTGNRYTRQPAPSYARIENGISNSTAVLFTGLPRATGRFVGFWCGGRYLGSQAVADRQFQAGDGYRIQAGAIAVYQMMIE